MLFISFFSIPNFKGTNEVSNHSCVLWALEQRSVRHDKKFRSRILVNSPNSQCPYILYRPSVDLLDFVGAFHLLKQDVSLCGSLFSTCLMRHLFAKWDFYFGLWKVVIWAGSIIVRSLVFSLCFSDAKEACSLDIHRQKEFFMFKNYIWLENN